MSKYRQWTEEEIEKLVALRLDNQTWDQIAKVLRESNWDFEPSANSCRKAFYRYTRDSNNPVKKAPKVLVFDIETTPIEAYVWGLFDQNIGLEMVKEFTTVLSWSAKWLGADESQVMYRDQRDKKNKRDDKDIIKAIWSLLDEADVVLTQNGIRFDSKKLNARFAIHKLGKPSSYKHIDTLRIAKKHFAFDSNKLAHLTDIFCVKYKKLDHKEFPGAKLWVECLKGNLKAFDEMEKYNKYDVLSLEELYVDHFAKWDDTIDVNWYSDDLIRRCSCGNEKFKKTDKFHYTKKGKYEITVCTHCNKEHRGSENLFSKEKRKAL